MVREAPETMTLARKSEKEQECSCSFSLFADGWAEKQLAGTYMHLLRSTKNFLLRKAILTSTSYKFKVSVEPSSPKK